MSAAVPCLSVGPHLLPPLGRCATGHHNVAGFLLREGGLHVSCHLARIGKQLFRLVVTLEGSFLYPVRVSPAMASFSFFSSSGGYQPSNDGVGGFRVVDFFLRFDTHPATNATNSNPKTIHRTLFIVSPSFNVIILWPLSL
jgi:hypothetical protein